MQNTKTTILLILAIALSCLSCSKAKHQDSSFLDSDAALLSKLQSYNENLALTATPETKSPNWKNIASVAVADISGAITGAKAGGKIGGKIGAFLGSPIQGATFGALVGGIAFGAFLSYLEYDDGNGHGIRSYEDFERLYSNTINVAMLMLSENESVDDQIIPADQVALPNQYEEVELVGVGHNLALEVAIENSTVVVEQSRLSALSNLEADILSSQELKTLLSDIYWGVDNTAIDLSISDAVVSMFLDAYTMISEDSVLEIANDYVEIISDSHALSVEEEREVYSALSVAVNTTYYWSQRLGR